MKYYKNPLVVRTFSTTVSIMGIDSQGINQVVNTWSLWEAVEYFVAIVSASQCIMRKWQIQILALQTTQDGQTTQPRNNIWNDVSLGWIPDPKANYTRFSNSLLAEFYQYFWATCPFKDNFRLEFLKEKKRQWNIKEMIERANNRVAYIN